MGSILDYGFEQEENERCEQIKRHQEEQEQKRKDALVILEHSLDNFLRAAKTNAEQLNFWQWLIANKDKIARNRKLIDLIG